MKYIDWERTPAIVDDNGRGWIYGAKNKAWLPRNPGVWLEGGREVPREEFEAMFPGLPPLPANDNQTQ